MKRIVFGVSLHLTQRANRIASPRRALILGIFPSSVGLDWRQSPSMVLDRSSRCVKDVEDWVAVRSECGCLDPTGQSSEATLMGLWVRVFVDDTGLGFYRCPCIALLRRADNA